MVDGPRVLHKYGEFAKRSGVEVIEPEDFSRKKKGKLSWFQRRLVNVFLAQHKRVYGYGKINKIISGSDVSESLS